MSIPDPLLAKKIIYVLGASGTPPEFGVHYFTAGLDRYLKAIEEEYLDGIVKEGLSAFKLAVGSYGGGKTHFLYSLRDLAWKHGYVTSYIPLNPTECPFDKLELVYKQMVANLAYPVTVEELARGTERGIEPLIRVWFSSVKDDLGDRKGADDLGSVLKGYSESIRGIESTSFANAVKNGFLALAEGDEGRFSLIVQWLKGEGFESRMYAPFGILERIDKTTAFRMMRSLIQWIRAINYSGLVLLFDEAERASSLASSRERRQALDNLRQIVDECSNVRLPSAMFFYAVPDDRQLLDGKEDVYEALRQRLRGVFSGINPSGVKVNLEELGIEPTSFLFEVGEKVAGIYELAYGLQFPPDILETTIRNLAGSAYEERYADISYRRLFVKGLVEILHRLRENPTRPINKELTTHILRLGLESLESTEMEELDGREF
ncbi:MAG: BREX system ATP-binding domain-containing protein [bacterium]